MQVGKRIQERYQVIGELGRGSMGKVYLVEDLKLMGKRWALKEMEPLAFGGAGGMNEAALLAKLQHPLLPRIVDVIASPNNEPIFLVMDYIQGENVLSWFERQHQQPAFERIVSIGIQICDLFHYLHEENQPPIVYRDLKPSNVMIDSTGAIVLIDFGVARQFDQDKTQDTLPLGTIGFASPEQFAGRQTDPRSDLYTLGAMLYFLASHGQYYYVTRKTLGEITDAVPSSFCRVVEKLLMNDPNERWQSALTVKERLEQVFNECVMGQKTSPDIHSAQYGSPIEQQRSLGKIVMIGGWYAGAGASFVTVALAKVLQRQGVNCGVWELPRPSPELYHYLFGERDAPKYYRFLDDLAEEAGSLPQAYPWREGTISWYPSSINNGTRPIQVSAYSRLLEQLKQQHEIVLIDSGHQWNDPLIRELANTADQMYVVADPHVYKYESPAAKGNLVHLERWLHNGSSIDWIANQVPHIDGYQEWMQSLPFKPFCSIPAYAMELRASSIWKGSAIQDQPSIFTSLEQQLSKIVQQLGLIAKVAVLQSGKQTSSWFFRKNKGSMGE